ncbi:MAG TPA: aspartate aminotransferase family protein [Gaiellaceae bacterium]|nr:aspartate aminotransferase family protein [Gaiellaceae bacterium]
MSVEERAATERVIQARERYVPRGVSTPRLVVSRAWGAKIWDADGREYLDFGGGIACQNLGHGPAAVVRAIHEQADRYLHQCFMVGIYEPYVEVARRLDDLWPTAAEGGRTSRPGDGGSAAVASSHRYAATKTLLVNSGAEAVENAVKIARASTGRAGVVVFDRAFHGRTNLTMAMTSKLVYKQGFGPLATDVHRAPAPYPYRGVSTEDALAGLQLLFKQDVDPAEVACIVLEPVQGEGGFIPMPPEFVHALRELCDAHGILYVDDEIQSGCGRTGTMWAIERFGVEPDLLVSGKTLGGGLPLAAVTGRADVMDAVHPGGLGGTFGGNPVACAAAIAVLDELAAPGTRERAEQIARLLRSRLDGIAERHPIVGEVRGLGSMIAIELTEPNADAAKAVTAAAFEKGLILLSCGLYGNVLRLLPPLSATDEELERGLEILEEALGDASSG